MLSISRSTSVPRLRSAAAIASSMCAGLRVPTMAALLIKESVNQSVDAMGFTSALNACFTIHQLNHAHWAEVTRGELARGTPEFGVPDWRDAPPLGNGTGNNGLNVHYLEASRAETVERSARVLTK